MPYNIREILDRASLLDAEMLPIFVLPYKHLKPLSTEIDELIEVEQIEVIPEPGKGPRINQGETFSVKFRVSLKTEIGTVFKATDVTVIFENGPYATVQGQREWEFPELSSMSKEITVQFRAKSSDEVTVSSGAEETYCKCRWTGMFDPTELFRMNNRQQFTTEIYES